MRKVRCDRGQPCGACVRRDESCVYERPPGRLETNQYAAEDRLRRLEATVKQLMQVQSVSSSVETSLDGAHVAQSLQASSPTLTQNLPGFSQQLRGEGSYVGSTHWSAVLDDIHGLKEILHSSGTREPDEPVAFEPFYSADELIFGTPRYYSISQVIERFLPRKVEVDRFLSLYFRGETFIIPFVHTYSFQRQYKEFWTDIENVNPLWLSMLFSICCLASMIGENEISQEELATRRSALHTAAGQCLVLGEYHRPQQFVLEALAM
jgi:hypothetical protein